MGTALSTGKEFVSAYAAAQKEVAVEAAKGGRQGHVVHSIRRMSHNTIAVTFDGALSLEPGGHVSIRSDDGYSKSYTPYRVDADTFTIAIKAYPGGKVSTYMHDRVRPGDFVTMSAPIRPFFDVAESVRGEPCITLALIGGGTGIAPMYSIARYVAHLPNNQARVVIFACFRNEDDVLLGDELVELVAHAPLAVFVYFVFSRPTSTGLSVCNGLPVLTGRFEGAHCRGRLPEARWAVVCGPPGFGPSVADVLETHVKVPSLDITIM